MFVVVILLSLLSMFCVWPVHAVNDWSQPCFSGTCEYSLPAGDSASSTSSGSIKIVGPSPCFRRVVKLILVSSGPPSRSLTSRLRRDGTLLIAIPMQAHRISVLSAPAKMRAATISSEPLAPSTRLCAYRKAYDNHLCLFAQADDRPD